MNLSQKLANPVDGTVSRKTGYLISGLFIICLSLIGVAQATNPHDINQIRESLSSGGSLNVLAQNACLDNSRENCASDQHEPTFSYGNGDESQGATTIKGQEYLDDRLSDKDQILFKSRDASYWQATDQETLKQVLFIHRHGDRTPIHFQSKDDLASEPFWLFHGLGQLTNRGKARLHLLGLIIRQRYDKFLNGSVNKNFRKSRSSGSLRCIESAQVFLSSFLGLNEPGSPDAKSLVWDNTITDKLSQMWQPASVNTLAAKYDGMLNEGAQCNALDAEYAALDESDENKKLLKEFEHEAQVLKSELGFDMDHFYKWFWASSLLEVERSYFSSKMKPSILAVYDRLQKAGDRALVLYQSSLKLRRARVGLLVDDMIKNMLKMRDGNQDLFTKKFVHYSGHDINLIFLLGILDNIDRFQFRPDYASNMMIELHQDQSEWYLKFFYMPRVPSKPMELHIEACELGNKKGRCTLDKFVEVMQKYRVTSWTNWMVECGNSLSDIDPYSENA